jgi:hypothetical protein
VEGSAYPILRAISSTDRHLIDEAGQPTIAARDEILAFFRHRLASSPGV